MFNFKNYNKIIIKVVKMITNSGQLALFVGNLIMPIKHLNVCPWRKRVNVKSCDIFNDVDVPVYLTKTRFQGLLLDAGLLVSIPGNAGPRSLSLASPLQQFSLLCPGL